MAKATLALGYYDINVQGAVSNLGAALILESCYTAAGTSPDQYCSRIARDPTTGFITAIDDTLANAGGNHTSGVDIGLRYEPNTPAGRFLFNVDGTWLNVFDALRPGGQRVPGKGNYDLGIHPDWTGNASITWAKDALRAGLRARLIGPFSECSNASGGGEGGSCWVDPRNPGAVQNPSRTVQPYSTLDADVSWTLKSDLGDSTIAAGVNNLLDAEPARIWNGFTANSDPSAYDYLGGSSTPA